MGFAFSFTVRGTFEEGCGVLGDYGRDRLTNTKVV